MAADCKDQRLKKKKKKFKIRLISCKTFYTEELECEGKAWNLTWKSERIAKPSGWQRPSIKDDLREFVRIKKVYMGKAPFCLVRAPFPCRKFSSTGRGRAEKTRRIEDGFQDSGNSVGKEWMNVVPVSCGALVLFVRTMEIQAQTASKWRDAELFDEGINSPN